ncbi:type I toxin-antitoxin system Fst family toxin [uncultured Veillonella sp.]|nr:type I toxin-antitoxin system Fst family toxin [uncultured Veillonella sp.]
MKYLPKGGGILQELFYALWGTLLAPIIVALVVTTYSYWLNNKNKK